LGIKDEIMEASFPKIGLLFATAINQRESLGGEISWGLGIIIGIIFFQVQCQRPARGDSVYNLII
jgi:hypothetical protein